MTKYFVSKTGSNGDGKSLAAAFRTIEQGTDALRDPGDELEVHEGTYVEVVRINNPGTELNPTKVYGIGNVVVDGRADVDGLNTGLPTSSTWGPYISTTGKRFVWAALFRVDSDYTHVDNFTIKRSMGRGYQAGNGVSIGDHIVGHVATNITTQVTRGEGIYIHRVHGLVIEDCEVMGAADLISGEATAANHAGAFSMQDAWDFEVRRCDVHDYWGEGIMCDTSKGGSRRGLFEYCRAWNGGWNQFYIHAATDMEVRFCEFWETPDWNPLRLPGIGRGSRGVNLRVMEQRTYDLLTEPNRNYMARVNFHHNKLKNIPLTLGDGVSGCPPAEDVKVNDCEFVRTIGLDSDPLNEWASAYVVNAQFSAPIGDSQFQRNRIVGDWIDQINNHSFFQGYDRRDNIWKRTPDVAANLGTNDTVDPNLVESGEPLPDPPNAPTELSVTSRGQTTATLEWIDNSDDEYQFNLWSSLDGVTYSHRATISPNTTTYEETGLAPGTTYYYRINAQSITGVSAWSNVLMFPTLMSDPIFDAPPDAPVELTVSSFEETTVDLNWVDASINEESFNIERSRDGVVYSWIHATLSNVVSYRDTGLEANTKYYYRVYAENTYGESTRSNVISVTTKDTVTPPPPPPPAGQYVPTGMDESPIVYVYDDEFLLIGVIDDWDSLIWSERYNEVGDFQMGLRMVYNNSPLLRSGNLLMIPESEVIMVIEAVRATEGAEESALMVTGESAESLLRTRFMASRENFSGFADALMLDLVVYNVTYPVDTSRRITPFISTPVVNEYPEEFTDQMGHQTIYDAVVKIAKASGLGFNIRMVVIGGESGLYNLKFNVYKGVDRTVEQTSIPPVIFAEQYDNVISSSYYTSDKGRITHVYVVSEDPVHPLVEVYSGIEESEDRERFEYVLETRVDRDIDPDADPPVTLTDAEVYAILVTRGKEVIQDSTPHGIFDGDYDVDGNFKFGQDFLMGDILSVSVYGRTASARIVELVRSFTGEGIKTFVSFDYIYE